MKANELKEYLALNENTMPLNIKISEVNTTETLISNIPVVKVINVSKFNSKQYFVDPFYKTISKMNVYEVPKQK